MAARVGHSQEQVVSMLGALSNAGVIKKGMTQEYMSKLTGEMLNFGKVVGASEAEVASFADGISDIFGAEDLAKRMDSMHFAAVKLGGTFSEVFEVMRNEGSFLHRSLGMNFDEIRDGLAGVATGLSEPAKKVGSAIQSSIMGLQKPSQDAIRTLHKLGIARTDVFDEDGKLIKIDGENQLVTFLKKFKDASFEELNAVFGPQAPMIKNMIAQIDNIKSATMADYGNPVEEMEKRAKSANGLLGELRRTATILKNKFGEWFLIIEARLLPKVKALNDFLAGNEMAQSVASVTTALSFVATSLALVAGKVVTLLFFLARHRKILRGLFFLLKSIFSLVVRHPLAMLASIAIAVWLPTIKQLYERWDDFCLGVSYLIDMLKEEFFGFIDSIMEAWTDFWRVFDYLIYTAKEWFANFVDGVKSYFYGLIDGIKEKIQQLVGYLPDFVKTKLGLSITSNNPAVDHVTPGEVHAAMKAAHDARVGGDVNVNFANAPAGMRVTTEPRPGTTLPTNVGYNLLSPAWGMGG